MFERHTISHAAPGKPRMTNRDKWKQRPNVMRYRAWSDLLRIEIPNPPAAETTERIQVVVYYKMPKSWSNKKRKEMVGQRKRTKPDPDNILKGVLDALWKEDQAVGRVECDRFWGKEDLTLIEIESY